jgi:hypothetical protein
MLLHALWPTAELVLFLCSQIESILNPVRGIRDAQARAGITPTDHSRHNILAIKEQSRLNALQKQQQEQQAQQQLRPQMRRTTSGTSTAAGAGPGGICKSLSGGGSRTAAAAAAAGGRPSIVRSVSGNGAAAGRGVRSGDGSCSDGRDFVQENKAAAAAASRPVKAESRSDGGAAYLQKSEYGQVPAYLLQRKMELAQQEEAMQAAKHAAQIPAGAKHSRLCSSICQQHASAHCLLLHARWQPQSCKFCYLLISVGCCMITHKCMHMMHSCA